MRPYLVAYLDQRLGEGWGELLAPSYMVMLSIAFLLGIGSIALLARQRPLQRRELFGALLWGWLGAMLGARALSALVMAAQVLTYTGEAEQFSRGMAAYGGFIGGAFFAAVRLRGKEKGAYFDVCAPALGLGTAFTRVGCYLAGCDFGRLSGEALAVRYPPASPAFMAHQEQGWLGPYANSSLAVHPTPLYECALGLLIFVISLAILLTYKGKRNGLVFAVAAALYAIGRIVVEAFRGDLDRGVFLGMSTSQLVSALVLLLVVAWVVRPMLQTDPSAAPAP